MTLDELARLIKDARTIPLGEGVLVVRIDAVLDAQQRAEIAQTLNAELKLDPQRAVLIVVGRDVAIDALSIDGSLFVLRSDDDLDQNRREGIRAAWEDTFRGRPVPPMIIVDRTATADPAASVTVSTLTTALFDVGVKRSMQDQAVALLDRFWIVPKARA